MTTNINHVLSRGVCDVIVREDLEKKLKAGKKLRIKLGIDPSGTDLTLGHAVGLRKLKQFQDLGHKIILLFGGFTATIGDPTGKSTTRKPLTFKEVDKNAETYLEQAAKILDINKCEIRNNRDWLEKLTYKEIVEQAAQFSASQIMQRDMFQERLKKGESVAVHEFLYPLMVAYDSVVLKADLEVGGTDQYFNLLGGRPMQKYFNQPEQNILTWSLLVGTDGVEKMSKSLGNYIAILDTPNEKFGKIMSMPDETMFTYFECLTDFNLDDIKKEIKNNPRDTKIKLAKEIITWLNSEDEANKAEQDFLQKFVKKEIPDNIPEFLIKKKEIGILDLISKICKFASSNGEARRLIKGGAVSFDKNKINDPNLILNLTDKHILKVGKRNFGKIIKK
jgi:tyrosyl-tRNA synthetase